MSRFASVVPLALSALAALPALAACGGDDDGGTTTPPSSAGPRYAIESLIFDDQGSTSYVSLLSSLAAQPDVALADAHELPGYAPADPLGGKLLVGSGEGPTLTRFAVDDAGGWTEEQTLSFAGYTSMPLEASLYPGGDKAYAPFETTNLLIWNTKDFTITGELGAPAEIPLERDGLTAHRGYSYEQRGTTLVQPYYYADATFHEYAAVSEVSLIDTTTDTVRAVLDVPCPHLHITSQDDAGNIYLSNGQGSIAAAVLDADEPHNCVARIKAGESTLDTAFTTDFRALTDGREGSNFFYVGQGVGFFNVYHAERDALGPDTEYAVVDRSSSYHLWTLDLATMTARPMEGIDYAGGQFVAFRIDGEMIVAVPAADYSKTSVYAISPAGVATRRFDVQGWAFKIFRLR